MRFFSQDLLFKAQDGVPGGDTRACRDATRKANAHLEMKLAKDIKGKRKVLFCFVLKYVNSKRKTRDNVGPLLNEGVVLVTRDAEKAEILNAFFALVFASKASPPP